MSSQNDRLALTGHARFDELVGARTGATAPEERERVERQLWDHFGVEGAALITDLAGFTRTSRQRGITHFLGFILRARAVIADCIAAHDGQLMKCDADNCYAFFSDAASAVATSHAIHVALATANRSVHSDDEISVSIGIDWGELLLVDDREFFGDPVNTASKLGEDLAVADETLVSRRALLQSGVSGDGFDARVAKISDVEIEYFQIAASRR